MLRWFAQGLGKGQLCVGSASLTSHHLPTSIISVKEHLEGRGRERDREGAWLLRSSWYHSAAGVAAARETRAEWLQRRWAYLRTWWRSIPGGMFGWLQCCKIPKDVQGKGRMNQCVCLYGCVCIHKPNGEEASWCPGLGSVNCFDLVKCFLQPWN